MQKRWFYRNFRVFGHHAGLRACLHQTSRLGLSPTIGFLDRALIRVFRLFFLLVLLNLGGCVHTIPVMVGNTPIRIIQEKHQDHGKTIVHLHENETTALAAARTYVRQDGGTLLTLQHGGTRNIVFYLNQVRYEVDPNRIFTDKGIKQSLTQFGPYSPEAHAAVKSLAKRILALIPPGKVIAVHNNRDYSMKEYFPHHPMARDVKALHYLAASNYRNFYFVTNSREYRRLKALDFNVALQSPHAEDDGSLSYYLGQRDYVNIEAAYGELKAQLRMIYHA